jgi:hypothetical protein
MVEVLVAVAKHKITVEGLPRWFEEYAKLRS